MNSLYICSESQSHLKTVGNNCKWSQKGLKRIGQIQTHECWGVSSRGMSKR